MGGSGWGGLTKVSRLAPEHHTGRLYSGNVIRNFKNTQNLSEHLGNDSQSLGHNAEPRLT